MERGNLLESGRQQFAHGVLAQRFQAGEFVKAIGVSHRRRFTTVKHIVVVQVEVDRDTRQSRLAGVLKTVLIIVTEFGATDRARKCIEAKVQS